MDVVVVESPAKARTINKYLGDDFVVLATYGHVRDLPSRNGSVRPDENFEMTYEVNTDSVRHIREIANALKGAGHLYLATDPDREGEAISWHVLAELEQRNAVRGVDVKRVVFNEITRSAVLDAIAHPRAIDMDLVNAQQARRALDYLVGFTLSPVLWRKLPGSKSAGRVQSVALRLICERELEIESFRPQEYWTVEAVLRTQAGDSFTAQLVALDGAKLGKFDLGDARAARNAADILSGAETISVTAIESRETRRNPSPPFTTSTLQQEAARKLGMRAQRTMQIAQRLYEGVDLAGERVGLITYMRTDGVQIAAEALSACRRFIGSAYGDDYVPGSARQYRSTAKNAQEAHEAIRPTDLFRRPQDVAPYLDPEARRLYELIWKRTIASQMESARLQQAAINLETAENGVPNQRAGLRATGSIVLFDGFFRVYQEGRDDTGAGDHADDEDRRLPAVARGDAVACDQILPKQHFTEPPPRYTEATLVKKLEELGIGRPSTYASIISVLQDRDYVRLDRNRFIPEDRGRLVTAFLANFFLRYVEYDFTARLEETLDDISAGHAEWRAVLREFWNAFSKAVDETKELRVREVLDALDAMLGPHFFHADDPAVDARRCPSCGDGRLSLKLGKFGAFIGCSNYPTCRYTRQLVNGGVNGGGVDQGPREVGTDPASGMPVTLRSGPYGVYVQLGETATATDEPSTPGAGDEPAGKGKGKKSKAKAEPAAPKPKRVSLPKDLSPDQIDLETALALLALPREIGRHPETGASIVAGIGRFGPYVHHEKTYASLKKDDDVLTIGLNRAVALLADKKSGGGRGSATVLRDLGAHPDDGKPVAILDGRYGPYVRHGKTNATLPKDTTTETLTLDAAVALLAAKSTKKRGGKGGARSAATGAAGRKTAGRKRSAGKSSARPGARRSAGTD
jgi:DNA topoisomerase-1